MIVAAWRTHGDNGTLGTLDNLGGWPYRAGTGPITLRAGIVTPMTPAVAAPAAWRSGVGRERP